MLRWIMRIELETGMCSGEILNLTEKQIDLQQRMVRLQETKNHTARTIQLGRAAAMLFQETLENPERLVIDSELVFFGNPGRDGVRHPYHFAPLWRRLKQQVGIEDFRFYDLQYKAVSWFVELGLSDQEVSAISGHKSMQMLQRYIHLRTENLFSKLDKLQY